METTSKGIETSNEFDNLLEFIRNLDITPDDKIQLFSLLASYIASK